MTDQTHLRKDIEGLRAIAVLMVVVYHAGLERIGDRLGLPLFGGGFVGVDVFFVISGYLITGVILRSFERTGEFSLRAFYAARARRLLPASACTTALILLATVALLPRVDWADVAYDSITATLFAANLSFASSATDYFAADEFASPFLHYWSLSLEEQFYIVWPAAIVLTAKAGNAGRIDKYRLIASALAAIALLSFVLSVIALREPSPWDYFGLHTRAWELALGAALCTYEIALPAESRVRAGPWTRALGLAAVTSAFLFFGSATVYPGVAALLPTVGTVLLLLPGASTGAQRDLVLWLLETRPLQAVGRVSYGWYLLHWPFIVMAGPATGSGRPGALAILFAVVGSFVAAVAMNVLVEGPVRRSSWVLVGLRPIALATICVAPVLTFGASLRTTAGSSDQGAMTPASARRDRPKLADACVQRFSERTPKRCILGDGSSSRTVFLVGDSHAAQWAPAFDAVTAASDARLLLYAKGSCPLNDVHRWMRGYRRMYLECAEWREQVLNEIVSEAERDSVVVLVHSGLGFEQIRYPDGRKPISEQEGLDLWRAGTERTVQRLLSVVANVVILKSIPVPGFDVPRCLDANEVPTPCAFEPREALFWRAERQVLDVNDRLSVLNFAESICPGGECAALSSAGRIKYRDGNHLTASFVRDLIPDLSSRLVPILAGESIDSSIDKRVDR